MGGRGGKMVQEALVIIIPRMMRILLLSGTQISAYHSPSTSPCPPLSLFSGRGRGLEIRVFSSLLSSLLGMIY